MLIRKNDPGSPSKHGQDEEQINQAFVIILSAGMQLRVTDAFAVSAPEFAIRDETEKLDAVVVNRGKDAIQFRTAGKVVGQFCSAVRAVIRGRIDKRQ